MRIVMLDPDLEARLVWVVPQHEMPSGSANHWRGWWYANAGAKRPWVVLRLTAQVGRLLDWRRPGWRYSQLPAGYLRTIVEAAGELGMHPLVTVANLTRRNHPRVDVAVLAYALEVARQSHTWN